MTELSIGDLVRLCKTLPKADVTRVDVTPEVYHRLKGAATSERVDVYPTPPWMPSLGIPVVVDPDTPAPGWWVVRGRPPG